jgi:hypothetical protein
VFKVLWIVVLVFSSLSYGDIKLPEPLVYSPKGLESLRKLYEVIAEYSSPERLSEVKVAVLDEGFGGVTAADIHKYLPANTKIFDLKDSTMPGISPMGDSIHGLHMAQIVWAMSGLNKNGPQFGLFNVNGPDNQIAAIKALLDWGAHIVVQSANFEMFGNMNGTGWINEHVEHAKSKGVIWLNTVGNYRDLVYNGAVAMDTRNEFVTFASGEKYLRFRNKVALNKIKIILNWNSYSVGNSLFTRPRGTDKDLDLFVGLDGDVDGQGDQRWKAVSTDRQVVALDEKPKPEETLYAREVAFLTADVNPKRDYLIAVKRRAGEFNSSHDKLRVTVYPQSLDKRTFDNPMTKEKEVLFSFESATKGFEVMTPADGVGLTVGSAGASSSLGPTLDLRGKPEILTLNNDVLFSDMTVFEGESASNAIIGGVVALLKGTEFGLKQEHLLQFRTHLPNKSLEKAGWKDFSELKGAYSVSDYLLEFMKAEEMRFRGNDANSREIGLLTHSTGFKEFKKTLLEAGYDFKKERIFIATKRKGTKFDATLFKSKIDDFKHPMESDLAKYVTGEFYELVEVKVNPKPFVGTLKDGTDNSPRFWKTPTVAELRRVVRGN